jgi:hypothetical protein
MTYVDVSFGQILRFWEKILPSSSELESKLDKKQTGIIVELKSGLRSLSDRKI